MGLNKICLITGATAGIGLETAKQLAAMDFDIYIVGRNEDKCQQTVSVLQAINPKNKYGYFLADFESLRQIRAVAEVINKQLPNIDVLINNAGTVYEKRELTEDGFEKTFAVNYLAPFLLTNLLLPTIKKSAKARIVNVASNSHYTGNIHFDDLHFKKGYFVIRAYDRSKLANVLFSNHLAKLLKNENVTVNSLNPGRVKSEIGYQNTGFLFSSAWRIFDAITGIPTAEGAKTSVYLASSAEVENVTGKYFDQCKERRPSKAALNEQLAEKLWKVSEGLVGEFLPDTCQEIK
jgi:NAD(P)-dependent dehydrogenase (short-subunit alcohol dehydrogenase family)